MSRRQGDPVECVCSLPCDVGVPAVLVDAEVVGVVDGRDELGRACGVEGGGVDRHPHENFLCGRGVVQIAGLCAVAHAVDARLGWPRDAAVGVVGHGVVL